VRSFYDTYAPEFRGFQCDNIEIGPLRAYKAMRASLWLLIRLRPCKRDFVSLYSHFLHGEQEMFLPVPLPFLPTLSDYTKINLSEREREREREREGRGGGGGREGGEGEETSCIWLHCPHCPCTFLSCHHMLAP
jgi:hypothetical protein